MRTSLLALGLAALALAFAARADEMSGNDKLRLLYSQRFTFNRDGLPLVTVELMDGQSTVRLSADDSLRVLPDGDGGSEISGADAWTITAEGTKPAKLRYWIVVSRQAADADVATWKQRGYTVKTFETGVVFGVQGDVIDSRELLLGVAPEADEAAAGRAAKALSAKWKLDDPSIYPELVDRPHGTLVAKDGKGAEIRNEGVLWFAAGASGTNDADATITVADVVHGGGGSQVDAEKKETRKYFGRVYVTLGLDGTLTVVNAVPEDRLLAGLVPSEMFPDAPREALKAQAVAARDELLAKIGTRHFVDPYLVCSSQHCQVYGGAGLEDARTSKAVADTRGEVLLRDGGGLIQAYYSASCGGFSENNENIWGTAPDPSLRGHLDGLGADAKALKKFAAGITDDNIGAFLAADEGAAFCGKTKYAKNRYRWTVTETAAKLDAQVAADYPDVGAVKELVPLTRGVSGRIRSLKIVGAKSTVTVEGDLKIRRLFGGLRSTLFVVKSDAKSWTFEGAGFGHGVGMCQTGAIGMAEGGYKYQKILEHYYPGSHVSHLY